MIATIVDTTALWETMAAALIAGVGHDDRLLARDPRRDPVREASRDGRAGPAPSLFGALAVLGLLATAAAIASAVIVMTSK